MPLWKIDTEPADFYWIDLFPAQLSVGGELEKPMDNQELRIIVTNNYFYVIADTLEGPRDIIKEPLIDFDGSNKVGYTVKTSLDNTYYFKRADNCGCGSRLRGFFPFDGVPMVARNLRK